MSILVIFGQNTKAIALRLAHFHDVSICNQHELILSLVICGQNTKAIALCNQHELILSLVMCGQNTKAIALLFGLNFLISSLFNHLSTCNQHELISILVWL